MSQEQEGNWFIPREFDNLKIQDIDSHLALKEERDQECKTK